MCGLFGASKVVASGIAKEQKVLGEQFAAKLEADRAEKGQLPEAPKVPELFTYRTEADGGYTLYFAEPAFMLPTDYFYVWDRQGKRWRLMADTELPP